MSTLSKKTFDAAVGYIMENGRELDRAWFNKVFGHGTVQEARSALEPYQWENGGFGRCLEPDHRTELPSCYVTGVAFHWFDRLGVTPDDPIRRKALDFLKEQFSSDQNRWPAFPREANRDPHAVWWHFGEGEDLCDGEKTWGLPSAEILGIMLKHDPEGTEWRSCFDFAVDRITEVSPQMNMNEASCFVRLTECLTGDDRTVMVRKLTVVLDSIIEADADCWTDYSAMPLMYIRSPESPFYDRFRKPVEKNLDWLIAKQETKGCWSPNWKWWRDEGYWPEAEAEWRSCLTVENLVLLKNFGKLGFTP